jgi:ABC-2 type transport system permease protein
VGVLWRVIVKEFLQLRQDRRMIPVTFLAPIVQIVLFGFAVNTEVRDVPTVLVDLDRTQASRDLASRFFESGYFELVGSVDSAQDVEPWFIDGRAAAALVIDTGHGRDLVRGRSSKLQLLVDGSDATPATVALGYAKALVAGRSVELLRQEGNSPLAGGRVGQAEVRPRVFYNPDLKSRWFYVPAILALILMVMTMLLSAMGIVREKEIGTMEQIIVTPIRSWQLIVGKLLPFAMIGMIQVFLITGVAVLGFRIPLRGSFLLLLVLTAVFLLNTLGLGLLVSTIVRTQQQAMMATAFTLIMPMLYLSGLIFPIENMPHAIQLITYAVPVRYYAVIIRGIFLKGVGISVLWPQALTMLLMGLGILALAAQRFKKRLD